MPIESLFKSDITGVEAEFPVINAGERNSLVDNLGRLFLTYCFRHDLGGVVYIFDRDEVQDLGDSHIFIPTELLCEEKMTLIPPGAAFIHESEAENGESGLIIIAHRIPNTFSLN